MTQPTLLFDGAMGTYYAQKYQDVSLRCELASLRHPQRILDIHREYLAAGAQAIKTNTFAANRLSLECDLPQLQEVIEASVALARQACADAPQALIFGDIGPIPSSDQPLFSQYRELIDLFLGCGVRHFLFETMAEAEGLAESARYIRSRCPDSRIIVSFAASPDGFTRQGMLVEQLFAQLAQCPEIEALGLNCVSGPYHYLRLLRQMPPQQKTLCIMPNAGYPTVVGERTFFGDNPAYFAQVMVDIRAAGAGILGGCCGTTPEYIRQTRLALGQHRQLSPEAASPAVYRAAAVDRGQGRLKRKLDAGKKVIAVELDPPDNADISFFWEGARRLKSKGVDAITIADCPVARARVDSSMLAAKVHRELDLDVIPHLTCRDRNINATKALLLGLQVEQVRNVLLVTGDPIPAADRSEVKGVFDFNSVMLANFVSQLNRTLFPHPFHLCAALNVNADNFARELDKAQRKAQAGIETFLTQPVFSRQSLENLALAHRTLTQCRILGGVIPVVSYRNACFMNSEMAGIVIPPEIIHQYRDLDRQQAGDLAVRLACRLIRDMAPYVHGYYLITPLKRLDLIERILEEADLTGTRE